MGDSSVDQVDKHILRKYEITQKLGKGAYAVVFKGVEKKSKEVVAIKKIFDAFQNSTDAQRTFREIAYLLMLQGEDVFMDSDAKKANAAAPPPGAPPLPGQPPSAPRKRGPHPNIIKLRNFHKAENDKDIYLVFDYMETDLHAVIRANILEPVHKQFIVYQTLKALKYCHSGGLLHRDLKPSNLLLNEDCVCKVADFGLARAVKEIELMEQKGVNTTAVLTDYVATRWYRAPEILLGSTSYTKAVDVWALGCIIAEMFIGKPLLAGSSTVNQIDKIIELCGMPSDEIIYAMDSKYAKKMMDERAKQSPQPPASFEHRRRQVGERMAPGGAPQEAIDLVTKMLDLDVRKRITIIDTFGEPWMKPFVKENERHLDLCEPLDACIDDDEKRSLDVYREHLYKGLKQMAKGKGTGDAINYFSFFTRKVGSSSAR